jgi:hypothetical protein
MGCWNGVSPQTPHTFSVLTQKKYAKRGQVLASSPTFHGSLREQKELAYGSNSFLFYPSLHLEGTRLRILWTRQSLEGFFAESMALRQGQGTAFGKVGKWL